MTFIESKDPHAMSPVPSSAFPTRRPSSPYYALKRGSARTCAGAGTLDRREATEGATKMFAPRADAIHASQQIRYNQSEGEERQHQGMPVKCEAADEGDSNNSRARDLLGIARSV